MKIVYIENPYDQKWVDFVSSQEQQASIFHHPAWIETIAVTYGYHPFVITVMDDENIMTGLPCVEIRSPILGKKWISLPFTDHCQPLGKDNAYWNILFSELAGIVHNGDIPEIEVRWDTSILPTYQTNKNVLHILKLESDLENIERKFHRMHRKNIKRAKSHNVEILMGREVELLRDFYRIHIQTRKRHGVPVQPWRFFENIQKCILAKGLGFIMLARYAKEWIGGGVFLHYGGTLTIKYTASIEDSMHLRPNSLIYAKAIEWAFEHGYDIIDMGKTSCDNQGLRYYKNRWGATETSLKYSYFSQGQSNTRNLQATLSPLLKVILQNSPTAITRAFGELFYGHFP